MLEPNAVIFSMEPILWSPWSGEYGFVVVDMLMLYEKFLYLTIKQLTVAIDLISESL